MAISTILDSRARQRRPKTSGWNPDELQPPAENDDPRMEAEKAHGER